MNRPVTSLERARDAVGREAWSEAYLLLNELADAGAPIDPDDFDSLAWAAWWLCRVDESIAARQRAYEGYVAAGADRQAGGCAWWLFLEHHLAGRAAIAAGWLARTRRHVAAERECLEHAFLAFAETVVALERGEFEAALDHASKMTEIARRCHHPDLVAMGLHNQGASLISMGERDAGFALVDEAMCAVLAGELSALFTGWIYCLALPVAIASADLRRAGEWTEAAMAWCDSVPSGTPYHGICRVHRVEVQYLHGAWAEAASEVGRACAELLRFDPRVAAEAFYLDGEIHLRRGDHTHARESFRRAHELGRDPQPGLALLLLAQGRTADADAALQTALHTQSHSTMQSARLLAARVEATRAAGSLDAARSAARELTAMAQESDAALLHAMAATATGAVLLEAGAHVAALGELHRARSRWLELGLPYDTAQTRVLIAAACRATGDHEGAGLELDAARVTFERLGAGPDARRASALAKGTARADGLTPREVDVLRLVAAGRTNRQIAADLVVSEHTVGRHLNNIFAKLDVSSRAAAAAYAVHHELV